MKRKEINEINEIRSLNNHINGVNKVKYTSDGNYCVSCSDDRTIKLWNPNKEDPLNNQNSLLIKTYSGVHGYQVLDVDISKVIFLSLLPFLYYFSFSYLIFFLF